MERWEWILPFGTRITARVDEEHRVESVWVGRKLHARFPHGATEGHCRIALPPPPPELAAGAYRTASGPGEAERVFSPRGARLSIGGNAVAPAREPKPKTEAPAPAARRAPAPHVRSLFLTLYGCLAMPLCIAALNSGSGSHPASRAPSFRPLPIQLHAEPAEPLSKIATSTDGSISVFHPAEFTAIPGERAVRIVRPELAEEMIVVSEPVALSRDLEYEHRRLFEIAMNLDPESHGAIVPPAQLVPLTCHGSPGVGAAMTLQVRPNGKGPIRVQLDTCVATVDARPYFIATFVPEALELRDRALFRRIDHVAELRP
jgi:hypothetical protein